MQKCPSCQCRKPFTLELEMAFQPIVDIKSNRVFAYEALVRGKNGESAGQVLSSVDDENKYAFDQTCRTKAIEGIARLSPDASVSINFLPNAIYDPQTCLAKTLEAADKYRVAKDRIIFEVTEHEKITNHVKLLDIFETYRDNGFKTAIDDFGEGFAGLNLLSRFQPDLLKLDMQLVQGIAESKAKQAIFEGVRHIANRLGINLIAEGIETEEDYRYLRQNDIYLMQGYLLARPQIAELPPYILPGS